jgi:formate-dependent nitrite reductase cytochrome c552 subunit
LSKRKTTSIKTQLRQNLQKMITNIYTAVQEIMRKLKDSLTLRKFEVQSVAAQAKRLAAAGRG